MNGNIAQCAWASRCWPAWPCRRWRHPCSRRSTPLPAGGTLRLAPGSYVGPVTINKPMTLDGGGKALIFGSGKGTVLSVAASGVTLRGLRLTGSGESHDSVDAGILVEGDDHRIEDNVIEDVLFGIHLKQVNRSRVSRQPGHRQEPGAGHARRRDPPLEQPQQPGRGQPLHPRARPDLRQFGRQPHRRQPLRRRPLRHAHHLSRRACWSRTTGWRTPVPASSCSIRRIWCCAATTLPTP
jgi:hypothetical protein